MLVIVLSAIYVLAVLDPLRHLIHVKVHIYREHVYAKGHLVTPPPHVLGIFTLIREILKIKYIYLICRRRKSFFCKLSKSTHTYMYIYTIDAYITVFPRFSGVDFFSVACNNGLKNGKKWIFYLLIIEILNVWQLI